MSKINPFEFPPKENVPLKSGPVPLKVPQHAGKAGPVPLKAGFARVKKWPAAPQWRQFFKILSKKEKIYFFIFFVLALVSFIFLSNNFYFKNTKVEPASGGTYSEGILGQPRFINPIYANSEPDRDLVQLIFSGLMKYNERMEIIPDLAEKYEVSRDGKTYTFHLRKNLFWQDKQPLNADDIIFTIKTIQDPDAKSPLRANWIGVKVEKIDDLTIKFKLQKPYSAFLENCVLEILPNHIWKDVAVKNFPLENNYNLNPVGSGPYKLKELKRDGSGGVKSILLSQNNLYFGKKPNISKIKFLFFNNEKELAKAAKHGKIKGLSLSSFNRLGNGWQNYSLSFPRYFAVFFNQNKVKVLAKKEIRLALNYATNKKEIVEKVLGLSENSPGVEKEICQSPILPKVYGFNPPAEIYNFDIQKAKEILEKAGFKENENGLREKRIQKEPAFVFKSRLKKGSRGTEVKELQKCLANPALAGPNVYPQGEATGYFGEKTKQAVINFQEKYFKDILEPWNFKKGTGIVSKTTRKKLNEICFPAGEEILALKFPLITVDQPQLAEVAQILKKQWKAIGVDIEIKKLPLSELEQDFIKPRNYEILLLGEALGAIPDPLPFWHSSQRNDPGLNMSLYANKKADGLLEENRESSDPKTIEKKLELFQDIVVKDAPAVFLYSPDYIYSVSKKVNGIKVKKIVEPSKRFAGIEDWYIKTKRVWK
jgi:ABC-type transport system substrate-binding protein